MREELEISGDEGIKWLNEVTHNSIDLVGEKAAFLGEVYNKIVSKKFVIPEGFVITKKAISDFFSKNKLSNSISNIFHDLNWKDSNEIERASKQVRDLIMKLDFPDKLEEEILESYLTLGASNLDLDKGMAKDILTNAEEPIFVAVRTSYSDENGDSYFNVKGKQNVMYSIKKCIASYFEPVILKEEKDKGVSPDSIRPAIIVQRMVQSDKSGILFSRENVIINAIWGLGGGLKVGEIGRDKYVLRRDFRILDKDIKEKKFAVSRNSDGSLRLVQLKEGYSFAQVLEEYEMQELADVALRIDDVFGRHMQFEFASEEGVFYIVKIEELKPEKKEVEEEIVEEEVVEEPIIESEVVEEKIELAPEEKKNILPTPCVTQTKIELLIRSEKEKEEGNLTGIKRGFVILEGIIKERGLHPNYYLENFNTKGYGELISSGIENLSNGLEEVWVRLSDFTTKDFSGLEGSPKQVEENPLMGLCGIRYLLSNPEILKRELKAISDLADKQDVCVLIPKISSVYELKKVKNILESIGSKVKVGIVLETPASIQLIKDFIDEGIHAVAFSGNSLPRYLLAIDPRNKSVKDFYDDTSPALMYQLEYVIRVCKRKGVLTKFFGNSLKQKEMVDYLVKKGIDSVVLTPEEVHDTSLLIEKAEKEFILGTDKEARNYEFNKEKERQKKELNAFEKIKDMQVKEEVKSLSEKEKSVEEESKDSREEEITNDLPVDEAIKAIEEERNGVSNEEVDEERSEIGDSEEEVVQDVSVDEAIKAIEEEKNDFMHEELKEHEEEKFDHTPEVFNDSGKSFEMKPYTGEEEHGPNETPNKSMDEVERAMREIEEHNSGKPRETDVEKAMREIEEHNNKNSLSGQDESDELVGEEVVETNVKELKENDSESFDDSVEDLDEADLYLEGDEAINAIEAEKAEVDNNSNKKDTLGIFG